MRFLIIGGGSIGKRHLKNLLSLGQDAAVCEPDQKRAQEIAASFKVPVFLTLEAALKEKFDAGLVTNPNSYHIPTALQVARSGLHLFIEKPLSHSLDGVDELISLVAEKKLKTLIGCNWKFQKSFRLMKQMIDSGEIGRILSFTVISGWYLPDWHPWEDYRKGYSANRSMGGGVLLDTHEFDYLQWFLGRIKKLVCFTGKYSRLEMDTEDIANLTLELDDRIIGSLHIDYIQHPNRRMYQFYGERAAMEWSFQEKRIKVISPREEEWRVIDEGPDYDFNDMYVEEMKHFVDVIQGKAESVSDIYWGKFILQVVDAARKSSGTMGIVSI